MTATNLKKIFRNASVAALMTAVPHAALAQVSLAQLRMPPDSKFRMTDPQPNYSNSHRPDGDNFGQASSATTRRNFDMPYDVPKFDMGGSVSLGVGKGGLTITPQDNPNFRGYATPKRLGFQWRF